MYSTKIKRLVGLLMMLATALVAQPATLVTATDENNGPQLPAECGSIQAPEGNKLAFHVYARGVQIYRWNAITVKWDFVAPRATLFAEQNYFGEVGTHYAGPTWESKSGSKVEGRRVPGTGCRPDPTAIEWLLLSKHSASGPGIFASVTFIQRVNTAGGLPPTEAGSTDGEVKEVPYTTEYYFYRQQ